MASPILVSTVDVLFHLHPVILILFVKTFTKTRGKMPCAI